MIFSVNTLIISVSVVFIGSLIYCIRRIEHAADDDTDSISELLV